MKTLKKGEAWRDENGYYHLPEGMKVPSVTKILGAHDDFLWVHLTEIEKLVAELSRKIDDGETHEKWMQACDGAWDLIDVNPIECLRDPKFIAFAGLRYLKRCADRGTACHEFINDYAAGAAGGDLAQRCEEIIFHGGLSCNVDDVYPYAVGLWAFLEEFKPEIITFETVAINRTLGYAGRPDKIMRMSGIEFVADVKTQVNHTAKRSHIAQTAAYSFCETLVVNGEEVPMVRIEDQPLPCAIIYVTPHKSGARIVENPSTYFHELFVPALKSYKANKELPLPSRATWIEHEKDPAKEALSGPQKGAGKKV